MRKEIKLKDSRIIPTMDTILSDKKVNIEVYTKLQIESRWNDADIHRYIYEDEINLTQWEKELMINRKTIKNAIEYLLQIDILRKSNIGGRIVYKICNKFEKYLAFERSFLAFLTGIGMKNLMKIYVVYYKYSFIYGSCMLTQEKILKEIGYSAVSENNKKMLKEVNAKLEKLGLIQINRVTKREVGKTKTILQIIAPIYYETEVYRKLKL